MKQTSSTVDLSKCQTLLVPVRPLDYCVLARIQLLSGCAVLARQGSEVLVGSQSALSLRGSHGAADGAQDVQANSY